jgi:hypothetical protein
VLRREQITGRGAPDRSLWVTPVCFTVKVWSSIVQPAAFQASHPKWRRKSLQVFVGSTIGSLPKWIGAPIGCCQPDPASLRYRACAARELNAIIAWRGKPDLIISDHGTEFTSQRYDRLGSKQPDRLAFHCAGQPLGSFTYGIVLSAIAAVATACTFSLRRRDTKAWTGAWRSDELSMGRQGAI